MDYLPKEVSDALMAFPALIEDYLPPYEEIPMEFRYGKNPWVAWQQKWFFNRLSSDPTPKPGIDLRLAMRHLAVLQRTYSIKHEHKEAAVAYLASLWFERP